MNILKKSYSVIYHYVRTDPMYYYYFKVRVYIDSPIYTFNYTEQIIAEETYYNNIHYILDEILMKNEIYIFINIVPNLSELLYKHKNLENWIYL